jgi:prophage antirepressor-like protein
MDKIPTQISIFKNKKIRKLLHKNEWWFPILDIIEALTDSPKPKTYWAKMKKRDGSISELFLFWEQLKLESSDGNDI